MTEKDLAFILHKRLKENIEPMHYLVVETENNDKENPVLVEVDGYINLRKIAVNILSDIKAFNNA